MQIIVGAQARTASASAKPSGSRHSKQRDWFSHSLCPKHLAPKAPAHSLGATTFPTPAPKDPHPLVCVHDSCVVVPQRRGVLGRDFLPHFGLTVCFNRNVTRKQKRLQQQVESCQAPGPSQEPIRWQMRNAHVTGNPRDTS